MSSETVQNFCILLVLGNVLLRFSRWLYGNVHPFFAESPIDYKSYGKWALVTGATDGIGKEYARALAQRGLNIILISRTLSKLQTVAKEIESTFKVKTDVIDVDFTSGPEIYDKIKDRVKGKDIGVLVNNVGMFYSIPEEFLKIPNREEMIQNIIRCNIISVPMMCSVVMPQMVARKKGIVINLSSMSAVVPCPLMSIYSASKAFVNKFSEDLATEYEHQGIIIQSVLPGPVATNMTQLKEGSIIAPTAKDFVTSAMKTVGFAQNTTGYWLHCVMVFSSSAFNFVFPKLYPVVQRKAVEHTMKNSIFLKSKKN